MRSRKELLDRLKSSSSVPEVEQWAHELRDYLRVLHVVYHTVNHGGEQTGAFTYSKDWARRYIDMDYALVDPVILSVQRSLFPINWKSLDWSKPHSRLFLIDAAAHGIGNQGWTVPIWGPGGEFALFAVNDSRDDESWRQFIVSNREDIHLLSQMMHQQMMQVLNKKMDTTTKALSPRECEALTQLSLGQSRSAVAAALDISENTLRTYIRFCSQQAGGAERYPCGSFGTGERNNLVQGCFAAVLAVDLPISVVRVFWGP